jgi:arylsulfatase A-like enzyme
LAPQHIFSGDKAPPSAGISRRSFLIKSLTGGSALGLGGLAALLEMNCRSEQPPNLLIVFPDQMRGQALGFLDGDPVLTPNLDAFARESAVFPQAVSNYPLCSPYRAMMMTGKYPHSNNVLSNSTSDAARYGYELRQAERCWSDVLKDRGYCLGYIGKWHLDCPRPPFVKSANNREDFAWNEWCPPDRRHGFDFWYAYGTYDQHLNPMYWATETPRDGAFFVGEWGPVHEANLAVKYLHNPNRRFRDRRKPFALVVSMNPPHMPYEQVPERYVRLYDDKDVEHLCSRPNIPPADQKWGQYYRDNIRNYLAMVTGVDEQFGRILKTLRDTGLERNTIVVFTSDHGNCLGIHDEISKNNHYEESMRIPLLIRWPGKIQPRRDDLLISVPDLYPTLLDLMGLGQGLPDDIEGTSYASLLRTGKGTQPTSQLYLGIPLGQPAWGRRGVRTHMHTMVVSRMPDQDPRYVLHDNIRDPYQLRNIADEEPEVVRRLIEEELIPWLKKTKDPWLSLG